MENRDIFYVIVGILLILVIVIAAIFSSLIVLILICNWHAKCRSTSNLLTINSCVAFLFLIFSLSIQVPYLFQTNEQQSQDSYATYCRIRAFLFLFACVAKVSSYLIQAISRYFIIILHKHRYLRTYRANGMMIIISWMLSLILSSGLLISPISFQYERESRLCLLTSKVFHTSFTLMMIAFVVPAIVISSLYGIILCHATRPNSVQPNNVALRNNKRDVKVFQNILLLLAIVVTGGTPYLLLVVLNKITTAPWPLYSLSILFIALSSVVEAIAIFFTNNEVKAIVNVELGFIQPIELQTVALATLRTVFGNS